MLQIVPRVVLCEESAGELKAHDGGLRSVEEVNETDIPPEEWGSQLCAEQPVDDDVLLLDPRWGEVAIDFLESEISICDRSTYGLTLLR